MSDHHHITREAFAAAFPGLVLGRFLLPKKRSELQMLLASVTFSFESGRVYSESQVNRLIGEWVSRFGTELDVDHVTLRRYLVDEGLLLRDEAGSSYRLAAASPFFSYDVAIRDLDLDRLVSDALEAREARKRAYQKETGRD